MEIKQLEREVYMGKKFTARYQTKGYYDIAPSESGFRMEYRRFDEPTERSFDDEMFGEWLEEPVAFGAFENGTLIGFVEGSMENWNNRFRISNICVFDHERRSRRGWNGTDGENRSCGEGGRGPNGGAGNAVLQ